MVVIAERSSAPTATNTPDHRGTPVPPLMLTAADVAALLACSTKTIYRLVDRGALPRPVRLGGMLRWSRPAFEQWLTDGCPPPRHG